MNRDQITFEHQMKHSYMVIGGETGELETYETKMLLRSRIPGTLKCSLREENGCEKLQYEISALQSMEKYFENRHITDADLERLLTALDRLLEQLEEYLLPETLVCLEPAAIFTDADTGAYYFACVPGYEEDFAEELRKLLAYALKKIDYADDASVILAYTLFQESSKPDYGMEELLRVVRRCRERRNAQKAATASSERQGVDAVHTAAAPAEASVEDTKNAEDKGEIKTQILYADDADGLLRNPADDLANSALYGLEEDRGWDTGEDMEKRREKNLEKLRVGSEKRQLRLKLILAFSLMLAIPICIWFLKGQELFMRMLPVIVILEAGILVVACLDSFVLIARQRSE